MNKQMNEIFSVYTYTYILFNLIKLDNISDYIILSNAFVNARVDEKSENN